MTHWTEEILQRMNWVYYLTHFRKGNPMNTKSYTRGHSLYETPTPFEENWMKYDETDFPYPQFTSNCCNARLIENTDICSRCLEHCEPMDITMEKI